MAPSLGWLIPGAGHLLQKRWIRGGLLLVSIGAMFVLGLMMNGRVYKPNGGDILGVDFEWEVDGVSQAGEGDLLEYTFDPDNTQRVTAAIAAT